MKEGLLGDRLGVSSRSEHEEARSYRLHLVRHRTTLKNRVHATLMTFGHPCPVSDLFGHAGRELLDRLAIPDPWRRNVDASLELIDDLELQIARLTVELRRQGAEHRYIPLLVTAPGFGWINAYTVASEIGDIERFASPAKLVGYTGLCPRVYQSGNTDRRGPISKQGSRYQAKGAACRSVRVPMSISMSQCPVHGSAGAAAAFAGPAAGPGCPSGRSERLKLDRGSPVRSRGGPPSVTPPDDGHELDAAAVDRGRKA
jgi:Transposase IS116/IS110/IS902 family